MTEDRTKQSSLRDEATAKRRNQILEAAVICFLEHGYHQTGVRDIAKRAGVSLGNLYNHFPGKHDVLVEIATLERKEMEPFLNILSGWSPAPKVLDRFVSAYAKYLAAPKNVILSMEIASEAIRQPDIAQLFLENREQLVSALTGLLERGIKDRELRELPDPNQASHLIMDAIEGAAYRRVLTDEPMRKISGSLKDFILGSVQPH